jgi:hypothetical protein
MPAPGTLDRPGPGARLHPGPRSGPGPSRRRLSQTSTSLAFGERPGVPQADDEATMSNQRRHLPPRRKATGERGRRLPGPRGRFEAWSEDAPPGIAPPSQLHSQDLHDGSFLSRSGGRAAVGLLVAQKSAGSGRVLLQHVDELHG